MPSLPPNRPARVDSPMPAGPRIVVTLVVAAFAVAGIMLTANVGLAGWGLLIVLMGGCMMLAYPRVILAVYWFWIVLYPYVSTLFPSTTIKWSDELMIGMMLGVLLMHYIQNRSLFRTPPVINRIGWALMGLIVLSTLVNQIPKSLMLHFILQYMRMFLLFYYSYVFLQGDKLKTFALSFVGVVLLQFVLNFGWFLRINPLPNWMSGPDLAIGTGLGANVCAYYSVVMLFLLLNYFLHSRGGGRKTGALLLMLIALAHLVIASTFHADLMLMVCAAVYVKMHFREHRTNPAVLVAAAVAVLVLIMVALIPSTYSEVLRFELGPGRIVERIDRLRMGPKGQSYVNNVVALPKEIPVPLLGAGPGNAGSMVARINFRPLSNKYFRWVDTSVDRYELSSGGSIVGGPSTGLLTLWSELGPAGAGLYWYAHLLTMLRVAKGLRLKRYTGRYRLILAKTFVPAMLLYVLLAILADYSWMAYMNAIWIWAGAVWRYDDAPAPAAAPAPGPARPRNRRYLPA